jgi:hypothetical protein
VPRRSVCAVHESIGASPCAFSVCVRAPFPLRSASCACLRRSRGLRQGAGTVAMAAIFRSLGKKTGAKVLAGAHELHSGQALPALDVLTVRSSLRAYVSVYLSLCVCVSLSVYVLGDAEADKEEQKRKDDKKKKEGRFSLGLVRSGMELLRHGCLIVVCAQRKKSQVDEFFARAQLYDDDLAGAGDWEEDPNQQKLDVTDQESLEKISSMVRKFTMSIKNLMSQFPIADEDKSKVMKAVQSVTANTRDVFTTFKASCNRHGANSGLFMTRLLECPNLTPFLRRCPAGMSRRISIASSTLSACGTFKKSH